MRPTGGDGEAEPGPGSAPTHTVSEPGPETPPWSHWPERVPRQDGAAGWEGRVSTPSRWRFSWRRTQGSRMGHGRCRHGGEGAPHCSSRERPVRLAGTFLSSQLPQRLRTDGFSSARRPSTCESHLHLPPSTEMLMGSPPRGADPIPLPSQLPGEANGQPRGISPTFPPH